MNNFFHFVKNPFLATFTVQIDPLTRKVSKSRIFLVLLFIFLLGVFIYSLIPFEEFNVESRDRQRISDLNILKSAILEFQKDNGRLPDNRPNTRFLVGGKNSLSVPNNNWLGVDLTKYLKKVPTDPKFAATSTAPYAYRYITNGFSFKLDAYLEQNETNLMQEDGGIYNDAGVPQNNRARYELGTDLSLRF